MSVDGYGTHFPSSIHATSTRLLHRAKALWSHSAPRSLNPWLGIRSRLFLSLFTPPLASLLFIFVGVLTAMKQASKQAQSIKDELRNACYASERSANLLANTPYYLATNVNEATAKAIDDTVHGLAKVLTLSLTAAENLLTFLVDMYRSLFLCFIELLVRGSLELLTSAVDALSGVIQDVARSLQSTIQISIDGVNASLRTMLGGVNDILKIVGQSIKVPQVPMPDLSALNNVTLPDEIDSGLRQLNNSLPTLDQLRQQMDSVISIPFEKVKSEVNGSIAQYSFDRRILPVPTQTLMTFCDNSKMDMSSIDHLEHTLRKGAKIGIGLLVLLAVFVLAFSAFMEWHAWQCMQRHLDRSRQAFMLAHHTKGVSLDNEVSEAEEEKSGSHFLSNDERNRRELMSLLQLSSHPLLATIALRYAPKVGIQTESQITHMRWWLAWLGQPAPLALLGMGVVGFVGVEVQRAAIAEASRQAGSQSMNLIKDNVEAMQSAVNEHLQAASLRYANASNTVILSAQDTLNNGMLAWVNTTTSTMNATLNELMAGVTTAVNSTFANTPLYNPVQSFVDCILGNKIYNIEKALTWIQSNAHVNFPLVNDTVLMIDQNMTKAAIVDPAQRAIEGNDGGQGIPAQLTSTYLDGLSRQRGLFIALICIYLCIAVIGLLIALYSAGAPGLIRSAWRQRNCDSPSDAGQDTSGVARRTPFDYEHDQVRSDSPAVLAGHQSISKPLLPEVASFHLQREYDQAHSFGWRSDVQHDGPYAQAHCPAYETYHQPHGLSERGTSVIRIY